VDEAVPVPVPDIDQLDRLAEPVEQPALDGKSAKEP
jgi:hypothetical protein